MPTPSRREKTQKAMPIPLRSKIEHYKGQVASTGKRKMRNMEVMPLLSYNEKERSTIKAMPTQSMCTQSLSAQMEMLMSCCVVFADHSIDMLVENMPKCWKSIGNVGTTYC